MAVRIMTYVGLLYQDLIRRGEVPDGKRLPPVLPIVLYNGDAKWTAATDIATLIPKVPVLRQSKHSLVLPKVQDLKELKMTLAERFDQWAQKYEQKGLEKGIEQGIEKGIEKGEALLLQRLLTRRFGALPSDIVGQIAGATAAQLEQWGDRVLDAASLEEVFRP